VPHRAVLQRDWLATFVVSSSEEKGVTIPGSVCESSEVSFGSWNRKAHHAGAMMATLRWLQRDRKGCAEPLSMISRSRSRYH